MQCAIFVCHELNLKPALIRLAAIHSLLPGIRTAQLVGKQCVGGTIPEGGSIYMIYTPRQNGGLT